MGKLWILYLSMLVHYRQIGMLQPFSNDSVLSKSAKRDSEGRAELSNFSMNCRKKVLTSSFLL